MTTKRKGISGTPWHTEFVLKEEDDPRRHKNRCKYRDKENYCHINFMKCFGSARCGQYKELASGEQPPEPKTDTQKTHIKKPANIKKPADNISITDNAARQKHENNQIILNRLRRTIAQKRNKR